MNRLNETFQAQSITDDQQARNFVDPITQTSPTTNLTLEQLPEEVWGFAKLPAEVQIKIWSYTLPDPLKIPFRTHNGGRSRSLDDIERHRILKPLCKPNHNPVGLQVCCPSREELLRFCTPLFRLCNGYVRYFDPAVDTICITYKFPVQAPLDMLTLRYGFPEDMPGQLAVQNLEVTGFWWGHLTQDSDAGYLGLDLPRLKNCLVILFWSLTSGIHALSKDQVRLVIRLWMKILL